MSVLTSPILLRAAAFVVDWFLLALWGGLVFAVVMLVTGGDVPSPGSAWVGQAVGFVTMTVPFTLYHALCETSRWRGSLGKRAAGLVVVRRSGEKERAGRALARNAIKFVPWEVGHLVAQQAALSDAVSFPLWLWGPVLVSMLVPVWWIASLLVRGATPYDGWTDTRVMRRSMADAVGAKDGVEASDGVG